MNDNRPRRSKERRGLLLLNEKGRHNAGPVHGGLGLSDLDRFDLFVRALDLKPVPQVNLVPYAGLE